MDLEFHLENDFQQHLHPLDEWIEWERREIEDKKYQEQLKLEKIDDNTKEKECDLLLKIIENCKQMRKYGC